MRQIISLFLDINRHNSSRYGSLTGKGRGVNEGHGEGMNIHFGARQFVLKDFFIILTLFCLIFKSSHVLAPLVCFSRKPEMGSRLMTTFFILGAEIHYRLRPNL